MTDETSSDNQQSMPNDVGEIIHGNSNHLPLLGSESTNAPTNSQTAGPALSSPFSSVMDQLHALDSTHSELTHMKNVDPTAAVTEQWPNGDKDTTFVRTNTVTETRTDSPNPNPSHTVESLPVPPVLPNGNAKLHGILRRPSSASSTASSGVRLDQLANTVDSKPFYTVELNNGHPKATSPTCVVNNNFLSPEWNPSGFDHAGHVGNGGANGSAVHPTFSLGGREPDSMNGSVMGSQMLEKHASFADMTGLAQVATKKPSVVQRLFRKKEVPRSFTMEDLRKEINMDDHIIPVEDVFRKLQVDPTTGLTEEEAKIRLDRDGKNELTPPKQVPEIVKFLREMVGGFSPLLLTGSLLCFIAFFVQLGAMGGDVPFDNLYLAVVLFVVVIITGVFLYAQKAKSQRIMESFKKMLPQHATVIRNGKENSILAEDLVLGDIVEIRGGDRVPADVRILDAKGLKVDNSSLTGESEAQSRKPIPSENPLESKNLCFYTTNAVEGWGRGIVIRRGDQTFMGRIARLTMRLGESDTTIAREIAAFVWLISIVAVLMGVICVIIPLSMGYDFLTTVILAIGLIVANVPEGIVIAVTVMLTLTAQKMAKKNCLIKNLEAVETLGSCSIICTDKTGTLTQNRMTVAHCWVDNTVVPINTVIENLAGKDLPDSQTVRDLVRVATLCNRAHFKSDQPDGPIYSRTVVGDASESALLKFVEAVDGHPEDARQKHVPVVEIPFNSTTKFQTAAGDKRYLLVMKGAPEQIWARCTTISCQGEDFDINQEWATKFNDAYRSLGGLGERVLGFCDLLLPLDVPTTFDAENPNFPLEGLRFLGLFSLIDPPRSAVPDAVAKCRSAGIRIIMVTGDHPVTAKAIGRGVGIISEQSETVEDISERLGIKVEDVDPRDANAVVVHGDRLRSMSVDEIVTILQTHPEVIFARTSPQQKLTIVEACQKMGAVVAVTGDGVNDSPALKKANIGIAMGITGSDVSKQAADMVLLDDNFASIVTGVEEGRLIFDNLKKTICYSIMSNVPEIVPIVLYFILSIPLGLTTIPMLLLCLVTDLIPAISMAHESAEGDIMKLPPRDIHDRLVNSRLIHGAYLQAGIICATGAFFSYLVVFAECGFYPQRLLGLRADWENPRIMDLKDSFGQEWTYAQRMTLQRSVSSAFFVGVVVFQWSDIVMRKMRRKSIFQKGMRNWFLNCAILVETLLAVICVYTPCLNTALTLHDIKFLWWIPVMPFGLLFCVLDEIRRFFIRCYPGGWVEKEFYF